MDILFISNELKEEVHQYCSKDLVEFIFNDFAKTGQIKKQNPEQKPSKIWIVSDYISTKTDADIIDKINVLLSFIKSGGIVQIFDNPCMTIEDCLYWAKQHHLIDDIQLEFLHDPWFYSLTRGWKPSFQIGGKYEINGHWYQL